MTYRVILSQSAETELGLLEQRDRDRIVLKLDSIKEQPLNYVKRLIGVPLYSLRVGKYRVIMDIKNKEMVIFIIKVGHRNKVYDNL